MGCPLFSRKLFVSFFLGFLGLKYAVRYKEILLRISDLRQVTVAERITVKL